MYFLGSEDVLMLLKLTRPIIAFDVETAGMGVPEENRIVELAFLKFFPDGTTKEWSSLVKPDVPIEATAIAVHHITEEMTNGAPTFKQLAANLAKGFSDCDFAGYNVRFDLRVLSGEMSRAGITWGYADAHLVDGLRLWQVSEPRSLGDAVRRFLKREPSEAHRAMGDTKDSWDAIEGLLDAFPKLPREVKAIHELCFPKNPDWLDADGKLIWKNGSAVMTFGKWNGTPLNTVDKGYLQWMLNGSFSDEVKDILRKGLAGEWPV
jgi:DNA polymerase-3 subunit epsilon